MKKQYGVDSMPETAENVAAEFRIARADQDAFALRSQQRALRAQESGTFAQEIVPVTLPAKKGDPVVVARDEHPRSDAPWKRSRSSARRFVPADRSRLAIRPASTMGPARSCLRAKRPSRAMGSRRALASWAQPWPASSRASWASGPVPGNAQAARAASICAWSRWTSSSSTRRSQRSRSPSLRQLGLPDDAAHVNPNGGAIALGHPLGASGARLATTATWHLARIKGRYALCTMCIGVGQGIAMVIERVA